MYMPSSGSAFNYYRATTGGGHTATTVSRSTPQWVRIEKDGSTFTSYVSADGLSWAVVTSVSLAIGNNPYACLASSSRTANRGESVYESVSVLPYPWISNGIGNSLPGFTTFLDDKFTVTSAGSGIGGTSDSGEFVCQSLIGDGSISAHVVTINGISTSQAGVMFRDSVATGSRNVYVGLSGSGTSFQYRDTAGVATMNGATTPATASHWIRLVRQGNVYSAFLSDDGVTWTLTDTTTFTMGNTLQACLATSSTDTNSKSVAVFQSVSVLPHPWTTTALAVTLPDYASYEQTRYTGRYTTISSGDGIGGASDSGDFVCKTLTGDGSISAKVTSIGNGNSASMGGVMFRENYNLDSPNAYMVITRGDGSWFQSRSEAGQALVSTTSAITPAYWLRVVRSGATFSAFRSTDSVSWTSVSSRDIIMPLQTQACLASSSTDLDVTSTTIYEGVSVLPAPWTASDIGTILPSFSSYDETRNRFTLTAAGSGIGGTGDAGHFMCQQIVGDGSITARVVSVQSVGAITQAGVMFRQTLATGSRFMYMYMPSSGNAFSYYRATTNGGHTATAVARSAPYWVRIEKVGSLFTSYVSADGISWAVVSSVNLAIGDNPYACLVSSSRTPTALAETIYENVSVVQI